MLDQLILDLTSKSLQSTEQLLRTASFSNIPSTAICDNTTDLSNIFGARNQIAREMDVDFQQSNRSRRPRARGTMTKFTNEIFKVAASFLAEVDRRLP